MATENEIAKLVIRLRAETGDITSQLKAAENAVVSFGGMFKKLLGGLSIAYLANELKGMVVEATSWAAEMEKMAMKTGMTTEALSRLVEAGDHMGVSGENIQRAMKFLNKAIEDARDPLSQARSDFEKLGVTFEDANKKALPAGDVFLQLADAVKKYGTEGEVLNVMQRLMGRGFQSIVPLAKQGAAAIKEMGDGADRAGTVIKGSVGEQSLKLSVIIKELGEQFTGFVRTAVYVFLPSMLDSAEKVKALAESMNSLKQYILPAADAFKVFAVAGLAAIVVHILMVTDSFATLGFAIRNTGFALEYFTGVSVLGLLKSKLLIAIVVVGLLANEFVKLRQAARDAAAQAESLATSYASGGLEAARTNVSNLSAIIGDLRGKQEAFGKTMDDLSRTTPFAHFLDTYKEAEKGYSETKAAADQYQIILDLLIKKQKALADAGLAKLPVTTDAKVVEEVRKKINDLNNSFTAITQPEKAARTALLQYIEDLKKANAGKIGADFDAKVAGPLMKAFDKLSGAQFGKKMAEANIGANLQQISNNFEALNQDLSEQYARGEVELATYFSRRRILIAAQAAAEIAQLEQKRPLMTQDQQIALDQEIANKRAQAGLKTKTVNEDERKSWEDLWKVIREGKFSLNSEAIAQEVDNLNSAYDTGIVSIQTYYDERDRLAAAGYKKTQENLIAEVNAAKTVQEKKASYTKLELADQKNKADQTQREWQRQAALRAAELTKLNQDAMLAASSASAVPGGKTGGTEGIQREYLSKQAAIEADYASKINSIAMQQVATEQDVADKKLAIAQLLADKKVAIENNTKDQANAIRLAELSNQAIVAQGMGDLFGQMYEASGSKMKAFFYLQKAMAIAMILIKTEEAAMAAMALNPFLGISMVAWVKAMGYASAAMVAGMTIGGMKEGGPVRGPGSETSDSIPAYLSRGEYVHPAKAVKYYGMDIMEAMRRMVIPKEMLTGFGRFAVATPGGAFAEGGLVTELPAQREKDISSLTVNFAVQAMDPRGVDQLLMARQPMFEGMIFNALRQGGYIRDAVRRFR